MSNRSNAHRAAGQAVAAILNGVCITSVSWDGTTLDWGDEERTNADVLLDAAVGLAGIVAVGCWGFGGQLDGAYRRPLQFDESQSRDIVLVGELIDIIDPRGADDSLLLAWKDAFALITTPGIWRVIESMATVLKDGDRELTGDEIIALFDRAMDLEVPPEMIAFSPTGPLIARDASDSAGNIR